MFCTNCGNELNDKALVCPKCGVPTVNYENSRVNQGCENKNGMAVAGFVCSFFVPLLGWIFGGIGLNRAFKRNNIGKSLSIAAIAIASASFLLGLLLF